MALLNSASIVCTIGMVILLAVKTQCLLPEKTICVGTADSHCESTFHCQEWLPLEDAIGKYSNGTTIAICKGSVEIKARHGLIVKNKSDIKLIGIFKNYCEISEILCYEPFTGFGFVHVTNLQILDIKFVGCSTNFSSTTLADQTFPLTAGLYITDSTNITIRRVSVRKSNGTGLMFIRTYGYVEILNCTFEQNKVNAGHLAMGGGLYIELSDPVAGTDHYSKYNVTNSRFQNNNCTSSLFLEKVSDWRYNHQTKFVRGGGINLSFQENACNNIIVIEDCEISENSAASGSGLLVHFENSAQNNTLVVENSSFSNNTSKHHSGGIGIYFNKSDIRQTTVQFQGCTIKQNKARQYGGGARIHTHLRDQQTRSTGIVSFSNCSFEQNEAYYGSAVYVDFFHWQLIKEVSIQFMDCRFLSNMILENVAIPNNAGYYKRYEYGKGALSCTEFTVKFSGRIVFDDNNGSAMYLSSCNLTFENSSNIKFTNNEGFNGGALIMFGASVLNVGDSCTFLFSKNRAFWRGGAIMYVSISEQEFVSSDRCFIQPTQDKQSPSIFRFHGNSAANGQAIFASTLQQCKRYCRSKNISNLSCIGNFDFDDNKSTSISTSGSEVNHSCTDHDTEYSTFPGGKIELKFRYLDEFSKPSYDMHISCFCSKL